jgi:CheY-like chemotaxis protein
MSEYSNPFNILLVEDEQPHQRLFERGVKRAKLNAQVTCVETGRQAVEFLNIYIAEVADTPLLVVLNINIPEMNGIELLAYMRDNPNLRQLPVVVLSTSDEPNEGARCKALGGSGYFVKPVNMEQLAQTILAELQPQPS